MCDDQKIRIRRKTSVLFPRRKLGGIIQRQLVGDGIAAAPAYQHDGSGSGQEGWDLFGGFSFCPVSCERARTSTSFHRKSSTSCPDQI